MRETGCNQCPIQLYQRLRPKRSYAAGFTAPFNLPRQLLETLRVACFPVGVRSAQVTQGTQGKPPFDAAQGKLRTSSVQVPNARMH